MSKLIDLTTKKFGRLLVLKKVDTNKWGKPRWLCLCDCGNTIVVIGESLKANKTKSCGCRKKLNPSNLKHGMTGAPTYQRWLSMKTRCLNPNCKEYKKWYGIRGITIEDPRWLEFENFYADMGECPSGMTLERIDNNRGYCKENCTWATQKEQHNNQRSNINITYDGRTKTLTQWAEEYKIAYRLLYDRVSKLKWSFEKAIKERL